MNNSVEKTSVLDLLDGMQVKETFENGTLYEFTKAAADKMNYTYCYQIYVPNNYNENTPVHTFVHGADDVYAGDFEPFFDSLRNGIGGEAVSIFYDGKNKQYGRTVIDDKTNETVLDRLLEIGTYEPLRKLGISTNNISSSGFSVGGRAALILTAMRIEDNPSLPPQTVALYNSLCLSEKAAGLSDDEIQLLANNHTTIIAFGGMGEVENNPKNIKNIEAIRYLTYMGINAIYVRRSGEFSHKLCLSVPVEDGAVDFLTGITNSLRNSNNYTFMTWVLNRDAKDYTDGEWGYLSSQDVADLISKDMLDYAISRYRYLSNIELMQMPVKRVGYLLNGETIESDVEYVINNVNMVITNIKDTNLFNAVVDSSFASNTRMPVEIVNYMHDSLDATGLLLAKLNAATNALVNIGRIFEETDEYLDNEVNNLANY